MKAHQAPLLLGAGDRNSAPCAFMTSIVYWAVSLIQIAYFALYTLQALGCDGWLHRAGHVIRPGNRTLPAYLLALPVLHKLRIPCLQTFWFLSILFSMNKLRVLTWRRKYIMNFYFIKKCFFFFFLRQTYVYFLGSPVWSETHCVTQNGAPHELLTYSCTPYIRLGFFS